MNFLTALFSTTAGQGALSAAIKAGAGLIYPRIIEAVKAGEADLHEIEANHPLLQEAITFVKQLLPQVLANASDPNGKAEPPSADDETTIGKLVMAEVGTISATDATVSGTTGSHSAS